MEKFQISNKLPRSCGRGFSSALNLILSLHPRNVRRGFRFSWNKIIVGVLILVPLILTGCIPRLGNSGQGLGSTEFVKGEVVGGFPSLPLYKGAQVLESYGFKGSYGASFISNDNLNKVVNFYDDSLKTLGWDTQRRRQDETNYVFEIKNAQSSGTVIINTAADGKKTAITMSVEPR